MTLCNERHGFYLLRCPLQPSFSQMLEETEKTEYLIFRETRLNSRLQSLLDNREINLLTQLTTFVSRNQGLCFNAHEITCFHIYYIIIA